MSTEPAPRDQPGAARTRHHTLCFAVAGVGLSRRHIACVVLMAAVGVVVVALLVNDARNREKASVRELFENSSRERMQTLEQDLVDEVTGEC
jgi:hypothetical protein